MSCRLRKVAQFDIKEGWDVQGRNERRSRKSVAAGASRRGGNVGRRSIRAVSRARLASARWRHPGQPNLSLKKRLSIQKGCFADRKAPLENSNYDRLN